MSVFIPSLLLDMIVENNLKLHKELIPFGSKKEIENYFLSLCEMNELPRFEKFFTSKKEDRRYLEIGSGFGFNLINAIQSGYNIVGIEPGRSIGFEDRFNLALKLIEANGISPAEQYIYDMVAENLSQFDNETFDMVFSIAVLEHVLDIKKSLSEAQRVLKQQGIMYMNIPNYNSFFEGHYNMLWIPYVLLYKPFAKVYVRFRGRSDFFIDELNFTTPSLIDALAHEVLKEGRYYILPHFDGWLGKFGFYYYFLRTELPTNNSFLLFIRKKSWLKFLANSVVSVVVKTGMSLGLCKVFNVLYIKDEQGFKGRFYA
ncbi:class I SAM-dependent methyltransferase [Sulfurospirillum barnesii]|uniref:Methylase involved in ubiquinone/menaquinone biosynthesis n=1 Tax=Sulfurospirillum barnesii (strain ATCC 700032 / DSM 10660 / SES-3) TaxID=760154 RepID=I3Y0J9_SULBS|nr:class I SAM-dependent methyltransferase [Sulfurospirillum barnesii]AFL69723.1 methylase involved in ubiquinone/menaquinone biosynthesis [Sulfurospirillum barnesii SES-3]